MQNLKNAATFFKHFFNKAINDKIRLLHFRKNTLKAMDFIRNSMESFILSILIFCHKDLRRSE